MICCVRMRLDPNNHQLYNEAADEVIKAGETYFVPPGHIPIIEGPETCVMVEFAESANKVYENIDKTGPPPWE